MLTRQKAANGRPFTVARAKLAPRQSEVLPAPAAGPPKASVICERLEALSSRVRRLTVSHRDPEAFHTERSSIAHDIQKLADELRPPPAARASGGR